MTDRGNVWVFAEQRNGSLMNVSKELLSCGVGLATKLKTDVTAVLLGQDIIHLAKELLAYGADTVLIAEHELLRPYHSEAYVDVIGKLAVKFCPDIFLLGATSIGKDLASRLAARLRTGLTCDCVGLDVDRDGKLLQLVPAFGGNVMATVICPKHRPQMATVRPGVMRATKIEKAHGSVQRVPVDLKQENLKIKILDFSSEETRASPIDTADVVIAGGWGIGSLENWRMLEELATSLGGAVGATRPPVDEKWATEDQLIGQSGKTVRPELYIGIALSGAMQHTIGIQDSRIIVAINNDPKAPIFKTADFGIVADFHEFVPSFIKQIRKQSPTTKSL